MNSEEPVASLPSKKRRSLASRAFGVLLFVAVIAVCVFLWPARFGGSTSFIIVGGRSMEPTYDIGDIVMVRKGSPEIGDVVAFDPPIDRENTPLVIHRIIGGDSSGWILQGDGNADIDPWRPTNDDIAGIAVFQVPFAGQVLPYLTTPLPWAIIIGIAVGIMLWPRSKPDPEGTAPESSGNDGNGELRALPPPPPDETESDDELVA